MDDISACYRILDLEPGASLEDVKRSYRELVRVWHPDRFRGDPKLQAKAEEKLKRINLAYERLSKEAAAAERQKAAPQPKKAYPERRTTGARATQAGSSKNTQGHAHRGHPQSPASAGHKAERFFRRIGQPWVATVLVGFVIVVFGMIVVAVQSARRKNAGLATTPVPKITNVAIERNEKPAPVLKVAAQVGTNAETAYVDAQLALEFKQCQKDAASGNAAAQHDLGLMYATGTGVPKDEAKAFEWYAKAAAQGLVSAQYTLGVMYAAGAGVAKDDAKAVAWWQKAAAQGDATAEFNLGGMYYQGRGIPKDGDKAFRLWLQAADQGHADAEATLVLAFEQYQKAAAQGNAAAQSKLGIMYARGRGVPKDEVKAAEWLQKAAVHGIAVAQSELGFMFAEGAGVPKDETKAVELWRKGAVQGSAIAHYKLEQLGLMDAAGGQIPQDVARSPVSKFPTIPPPVSTQKTDDAMLRHLATDNRLTSGSPLVDHLRNYAGKGKLTLDNGLPEDAYVKFVLNSKLVAAFYVRSHEKYTYSTIPDGSYSVIYCTGYGWDGTVRNFARGRHARRYDNPLNYSTSQARDGSGVTTYTDVVTLTLHKVIGGSAKASDMSLEDFDRY